LDTTAAYSIGDSGNVEKKSFLGQIWTSLKTNFASGRQSVAADNQKVLLALSDQLLAGGVADSQVEGFIGRIDSAVISGQRAITGGDIKGLLRQAQEQQVSTANRLFSEVMTDISGTAENVAWGESSETLAPLTLDCTVSVTVAISLFRHMPTDHSLSTAERHHLGHNIAERLAVYGLGQSAGGEQDRAGNYLHEMSSNDFRNLCQDFADGLIVEEDTPLSTEERSTLTNNITSVLNETRQALANIHTAGAPNMAQGGTPDAMGVAGSGTGSGPISDRANHVWNLQHGKQDSFLNAAHLLTPGNSSGM
jgi:hypothetical protein